MGFFSGFTENFWNPDVWLMLGLSWEDVQPTPENGYPNSADLLPTALGLVPIFFILQYCVLTPFVFKPFGRAIGLKEQDYKKPPENKVLERLFGDNRRCKVPQSQVLKAAYSIGWTDRQVQRWLRHRRAANNFSTMSKFCDCCWQLCYYFGITLFGAFVLYDKPWLWNIYRCWDNFPFQSIKNDLWWYLMTPFGYYTYMFIAFLFQPKRKDSLQMLLHHLITMILIALSFTINAVRMASLVLLIHECGDIPLFLTKMSWYSNNQTLGEFMFLIFVFGWVVTRLVLFPFWILKNVVLTAFYVNIDKMCPIYFFLVGLLCSLLVFHIIWTYFIVQVIFKKLKTNVASDIRSDEEEISEDFEEFSNKKEI